ISETRRQEYLELAHICGVRPGQLYFHNGIDDSLYRNLLRKATALVTTSRSEGYGLPVAEAMSEGTPVILSNLEIFDEFSGRSNASTQFVDICSADVSHQVADAVLTLEVDKTFIRTSVGAARQAQTLRRQVPAKTLLGIAEDIPQRRSRRT